MDAHDSIRQLYPASERAHLDIGRIKGDASSRQYFRVRGPHGSSIVCADPSFRGADREAYPFLVVRDLFARHGVRVPKLLDTAQESGLLRLEDCGDLMLQDEIPALDRDRTAARYRMIIDLLVSIQSIRPDDRTPESSIPFSLGFDREKLMFEFDFFIEHALNGYFPGRVAEGAIRELREEFLSITDSLVLPEHFVLNHRDFHSRNIMLAGGEPVVIDFQDARMGLPQYDAVSLLRDSYVRLEADMVEELKRYHFDRLVHRGLGSMDWDGYVRLFDLMAFQRNIKAVGTFCHQTAVVGNRSFEPCIEPTLAYLRDYITARPELQTAGRLLEPIITGISR